MTGAPAWVRNGRMDFLAGNRLGYALYSEMFTDPIRPANNARFLFLNPRSAEFYADWERVASDAVAILRAEAGRNPYDRGLTDLIGELSTRSETFRTRWAAHNVRFHRTGSKRLHHPVVGDLDLSYEAMELPGEDLSLLAYTAEPGSPSHDALNLLASWAATLDPARPSGGGAGNRSAVTRRRVRGDCLAGAKEARRKPGLLTCALSRGRLNL
jgi:hypothetical protein